MDANATTPLLPEVVEAMRPYWTEQFGNASSIHLDGQQARTAIDRARETLAEFFNCHEAEVVFNSGGTEGDNTALTGLLHPGDHLITTSIEHSAVLQPVAEIGKAAADTGVFFHIDAVQGAGKVKFDVRKWGCHLVSISGHKVHAPKGVGAMFVRKGTPVESLIVGGSHERRRRAGTENVPGIVALAKAVELG